MSVIQETVGIADQPGHAAFLETVKLLEPPKLLTVALAGFRVVLHETPSCVTVKVAPPETEIVPVRELVPVFSLTE